MSDHLFEETPAQQMEALAFLLGAVADAGLSMTPDEIGEAGDWIRRRAEVQVFERLVRRARRGRPLAPDVQAALDQWAAGYVGAPPQIGSRSSG